jgi:parallel beta-helix repeat protein
MTDGAVVDAAAGTILLSAAGDIGLGGLVTTNATSDAVKITSTGGAIVDGGDTDTDIVATAVGAVVTLKAATGIGVGNAIEINASSVEATTTAGGIGLSGVGNLSIGVGGLSAPGVIALSATGSILVPTGGQIIGGSVTANKPIRWTVLNTADTGAGSLRQVIANANATGVEGVAVFTGQNPVFTPASPLPAITTKFKIDATDSSGLVLDGRNKTATGLSLAAGSAGSTLRGISVRNFTGTGIVLDSSAGTTVSGCVIQANGNGLSATGNLAGATVVSNTFTRNQFYGIQLTAARGLWIDGNTVTGVNTAASMGLYAAGDLAGTRITGNTFTAGLRGALLDGAKNLAFGEAGRGNSLVNNRAAPGTKFAGTGLRAQGNLVGTTIRGNTFAGNNYGMAFINAQNLIFGSRRAGEGNAINNSSIAAVFVEGNNAGSAQVGTALGAGNKANAKTIQRVKGSSGL